MAKVLKVLCVGGSDSGAGAGIQADLKTISTCGCYATTVITAVTAQNTCGVQGVLPVPPQFIARQLDAVLSDIGADAVKTGMFSSPAAVAVVVEKIKQYRLRNVVVDPVMVAKGGHPLTKGRAIGGIIKELLPVAGVVTPNIPEAEVLSGYHIRSVDDMKKAASLIHGLGVKNVVIKGGHLALSRKTGSIDILYDGKSYHEFSADWIRTKNTHGTGCTFAAALAAYLARGADMPDAVVAAKSLVTEAIRGSLQIGKGHGPVSARVRPINTNVRDECLNELQKAFFSLEASNFASLVPEVSSNLVYARPGARNEEDVAGFPGRIFRFYDSVCVVSEPAYGASQHMANVVLTVLKKNPDYRSAMNIKYTERIIDICRESGLEVCFFDRADEQADKKSNDGCTLKWGVHQVLERTGKIPNIIFDRGGQGKEPMIRVLGKNPADVVGKVLAILKNLDKGES